MRASDLAYAWMRGARGAAPAMHEPVPLVTRTEIMSDAERVAWRRRFDRGRRSGTPVPNPAAPGRVVTRALTRIFPLAGIEIRRSGDGRTVEAYAACFDSPYEVRDQFGHYRETIARSAFDEALRAGALRTAMCLYNHGMTVHGTPDGMASIPLGTPLEIRPDGRGLLTVTRYNRGPFADQVLAAIENGDIRGQSFRGRIVRSSPERVPVRRSGGPLPVVRRLQLGLADYGPTPIPCNAAAKIVAVRRREVADGGRAARVRAILARSR